MLHAAETYADPIAIRETGHHATEATVVVDATPSQVYALVTDYDRWPRLLSDVRNVKVEREGRENARVRFHSDVFKNDVTVQFANQPDHLIQFEGVKGPPGGRARGSFLLEPLDGGRKTRVTASLYLDVVGLPSLFVGESKLRPMREAKLRADMNDVLRRLDTHDATASTGT
jgi:uncharacterized membrane protein